MNEVQTLLAELRDNGYACERSNGNGHWRVLPTKERKEWLIRAGFKFPAGGATPVIVPSTPSDGRSLSNARQQLKSTVGFGWFPKAPASVGNWRDRAMWLAERTGPSGVASLEMSQSLGVQEIRAREIMRELVAEGALLAGPKRRPFGGQKRQMTVMHPMYAERARPKAEPVMPTVVFRDPPPRESAGEVAQESPRTGPTPRARWWGRRDERPAPALVCGRCGARQDLAVIPHPGRGGYRIDLDSAHGWEFDGATMLWLCPEHRDAKPQPPVSTAQAVNAWAIGDQGSSRLAESEQAISEGRVADSETVRREVLDEPTDDTELSVLVDMILELPASHLLSDVGLAQLRRLRPLYEGILRA